MYQQKLEIIQTTKTFLYKKLKLLIVKLLIEKWIVSMMSITSILKPPSDLHTYNFDYTSAEDFKTFFIVEIYYEDLTVVKEMYKKFFDGKAVVTTEIFSTQHASIIERAHQIAMTHNDTDLFKWIVEKFGGNVKYRDEMSYLSYLLKFYCQNQEKGKLGYGKPIDPFLRKMVQILLKNGANTTQEDLQIIADLLVSL